MWLDFKHHALCWLKAGGVIWDCRDFPPGVLEACVLLGACAGILFVMWAIDATKRASAAEAERKRRGQ